MAHLFLASQTSDDLQGKRTPKSSSKVPASSEKDVVAVATRVPHVNEVQLTAATGGAEASCYRCTVPFGLVVLVAGLVVTAVAYAFNTHGSNISLLGLGLLGAGLGLLGSSALCWRLRGTRKDQKDRRRESQTDLMAGQEV